MKSCSAYLASLRGRSSVPLYTAGKFSPPRPRDLIYTKSVSFPSFGSYNTRGQGFSRQERINGLANRFKGTSCANFCFCCLTVIKRKIRCRVRWKKMQYNLVTKDIGWKLLHTVKKAKKSIFLSITFFTLNFFKLFQRNRNQYQILFFDTHIEFCKNKSEESY